jgi:hypothetical protein
MIEIIFFSCWLFDTMMRFKWLDDHRYRLEHEPDLIEILIMSSFYRIYEEKQKEIIPRLAV